MSKPQLSQISIKSVIKIFTFLDHFLENERLDPQYFKDNLEKFTSQERYFLYLYSSEYFSVSTDGFLHKWIDNWVSNYLDEDMPNEIIQIADNANSVRKIINSERLKIAEKEFLKSKQIKEDEDKYFLSKAIPIFEKSSGDFRKFQKIPLYVKQDYVENFKQFFFEILKDSLDLDSIKKLYLNTFEFYPNTTKSILLYLRVEQKALLEEAFKKITQKYKEDILHRMSTNYIEKSNSELKKRAVEAYSLRKKRLWKENLKKKSPERLSKKLFNEKILRDEFLWKKFIPKKFEYTKVARIHFMKAMYNAFPYIRDAYKKSLIKDPSLSLDDFLTKKMKNLKNA